MNNHKKDKEARKLELVKMSLEGLREILTAHSGAPTPQELEKLHTVKLIETIIAVEFPDE